MTNFKYYSVYGKNGSKICDCSSIQDAIMMVQFDPDNRTYREQKFIFDQIIDVISTIDKQLPGQLGLPESKDSLPFQEENMLPDTQEVPLGFVF
jgi:hypothetical protein